MNRMKLILPWADFLAKIDSLVTKSADFENELNAAKTVSEFTAVQEKIKFWATTVRDLIKNSFDPINDHDSREFFYASQNRFNPLNVTKPLFQLQKEAKEDLKVKYQFLEFYKKKLSIADAIIYPDKFDFRKKLDTEGVLNLILEKLYDLYDGRYHPIDFILEGNGVELNNLGEDRELAKTLEEQGLINVIHVRSVSAQLTIQGKIYVENRRQIYVEDYEEIKESAEEMNQKVDDILERLTKLGYGQEIIFNEIEELKELYVKLSKKTWGQVVKGKLIDLAIGKLVGNDVLEYIYKHLTDHQFHLPS